MRESPDMSLNALHQPRDALFPSAFLINAAEAWALDRSASLAAEECRLTSLWYLDFVRQHVLGERKTRYIMRVAQSVNYGVACGLFPALPEGDDDLVGQDVRLILRNRLYRDAVDRVAFVDLLMGHIAGEVDEYVSLNGTLHAKYAKRSRIFADQAARILQWKGRSNWKSGTPHILVIGATAGIIGALIKRGFYVSATDECPAIVGTDLGGVKVRDGRVANGPLIKQAELAIITGMTLPNRTLPKLMKLARKYNTSTMIWAITGKNFGRYYTQHGADCVISDPSPFLLLPGPATLSICRREN